MVAGGELATLADGGGRVNAPLLPQAEDSKAQTTAATRAEEERICMRQY